MSFEMTPEAIKLTRPGGPDVFDTSRRTANLIPEAALTGTKVLNFPNLHAGPAQYFYSRGSRDGDGGPPFAESCATYGTIARQEWGPGKTYDIPRIALGAVPAGVDHLDVQISLVQTAAPGTIMGFPIRTIVQGQWMSLGDNFAIIEEGGALKRGLFFEVIDGVAYVSLYQSAGSQYVSHIETKTNTMVSYLPPNPPFPHTVFWHYGQNDSSPCSRSFSVNLASTWSMTFKVTPGRTT